MNNMKNRFTSILLSTLLLAVLAVSFILSACTQTAKVKVDVDVKDVEKAATEYLATEMGKYYDKSDACIPWAYMIATEVASDDSVTVYGDFWVDNYDVKGDTLMCVSGGNFAGVMHMKKDGNNYKVVKFDQVEDGENYTKSAKKLFGSYYDAWAKFTSDDDAKRKVRTEAVSDYVKAHNLKVTQYQDYGWQPVSLEAR